ncbi:MAG: ParB/RepB/Spo0J family partition protein [Burkholderiales bacterium]|nr:ParB/RepB/Spo0J family partition protein [Burkholderiales bacterium]
MTKMKKGLGKGLDILLKANDINLDVVTSNKDENNGVAMLAISSLQAGKYQPRRIFNEVELNELADSIRINGVIQPIVVRSIGRNKYEIIAGERRFRASIIAGLVEVPVVIREFSDEEALAISLIENIQRKDLNIIEEAFGYSRLIEEFNLTHEELAKVTGKSRSNISNTLRLLNLSQYVLDLLMNNQLDMGHARALLPLSVDKQKILADETIAKKLTTAEVENKVSRILHEQEFGKSDNSKLKKENHDVARYEQEVADKIGMMVSIKHNRKGHGKIVINYSNVDELNNLIERIN